MVGVDDECTEEPEEYIHTGPKSFSISMERYVPRKTYHTCANKERS